MNPAVAKTADLDRIRALPRRKLDQLDAETWADVLTESLAERGSTARLRPWQAFALAEVASVGGGFLALPVGLGKTLVTYHLPAVCECSRAMLVIPAALEQKTWGDFASYRGVWRSPGCAWKIVTKERAYRDDTEAEIRAFRPQIIIIDEGDEMSGGSGGSRVLDRIVHDLEPIVVILTGTPGRKSILDYWHQLIWCFGRGAPVPLSKTEAEEWAAALDEKSSACRRPGPGALGPTLDAARAWYQARLAETPGVVIVDGDSCSAPLTVRVRLALEDPILDRAYRAFLEEQENPGGIPVSDPLSRWLLDGQLGCGLYSYWDPPPPPQWVEARRAAAKFARDQIEASERRGDRLDTEGKVFRRFAGHPIVARWREEKPAFAGKTKVKWVSDSTIRSALAWLAEDDTPGIIWCGSVDFGRELARRARLPYYGRLGKCETDPARPGLHAVRGDCSIVASWQANKKGFNLQAYGRQLLIFPPQSAKWLEQIFGRSHRSGREGEVVIDILATSGGTIDAFDSAINEARFGKATIGLTQKLLRADIVRERPVITGPNEFRWATRAR